MNSPEASHEYKDDFFDYINAGSTASARVICPLLVRWLSPTSLLDVGCGAGAWCKQWSESGVANVRGVDGEYVNLSALLINEDQFTSRDLSQSFDLSERFDLVTSLEVAEHVAESSAKLFVENLARHGDAVMFSAAVPGQGGEFHVNEQPLEYWRAHFAALGFRCFDPVRPRVVENALVEPWYRYNTLLYVRGAKVDSLPREILDTEVIAGSAIKGMAPLSWRARNAILRNLPEPIVSALVQVKHAWTRKTRSGAAS
jgi:SAM-dependent methyltransferase